MDQISDSNIMSVVQDIPETTQKPEPDRLASRPENLYPGMGLTLMGENRLMESNVITLKPLRAVQAGKGNRAVSVLLHRPSILAYHNIAASVKKGRLMKDSVREADFERQMSLLKEKRFNVIPVQQLIEMINAGGNIPPKTVALTFDDGYGSVCTRALPILRSHAFSACVFLATHYMGNNRSFPWLRPDPEEDARPLGWEEVERLRRENLEIGSHTALHKFLPALRNGELEKELLDSRDTIRQKMGAVPTFFALPFSFPLVHRHWPGFRERLLFALSKAGYECCCTLQRGRVSAGKGILFLPRVPVMRDDGPARFLAKALGLYSYTGFAQYLFQRFFKAYGEAQGR